MYNKVLKKRTKMKKKIFEWMSQQTHSLVLTLHKYISKVYITENKI